jgi:hypothetical protein
LKSTIRLKTLKIVDENKTWSSSTAYLEQGVVVDVAFTALPPCKERKEKECQKMISHVASMKPHQSAFRATFERWHQSFRCYEYIKHLSGWVSISNGDRLVQSCYHLVFCQRHEGRRFEVDSLRLELSAYLLRNKLLVKICSDGEFFIVY